MIRQKSLHILLLGSFVLLSGCTKELSVMHDPGSTIRFGAATYWQSDALTKTEYSGELLNSNSVERINWVPGYDRIRIYSPQATLLSGSAGASADYNIQDIANVTNKTGVRESQANIMATEKNGLQWGTSWPHYFFAMYPAAGMTSEHGAAVSSSDAALTAGSGNAATITGRVPKDQTVYKTVSGDVVEYKANMNHAYMYDVEKVEQGSTGNVKLSFKPLVTAFEVTLKGVSGDLIDLPLTSVTLSSVQENGHYLAGKFTTTLGYGSTGATFSAPTIANDSNRSNEITVSLPDPVKLTTDKTVKVTILALPVSQGMLKLTLTFGNNEQIRTLELKNNGEFVTIAACKKIYILNLGVPDTTWEYHLTNPDSETIIIWTHNAGSGSAPFLSYRESNSGWQEPVGVSFEYAAANADGTCSNNWVTNPPTGLTSFTASGTGTTKTATATVSAHSQTLTSVNETTSHADRLKSMSPSSYGTSAAPFDLSMYDFETRTTRSNPTTANCYIVDRPGYYMFPVVYGNSIDYTKSDAPLYAYGVNQYAYKDRQTPYPGNSGGSPYLKQANNGIFQAFTNGKGWPITDPFVVYDMLKGDTINNIRLTGTMIDSWGTSDLASNYVSANLLWADASGVISDVSIVVIDKGTSSPFFHPDGTRVRYVPYIRFSVSSTGIKQCNAAIAVNRWSNPTPMWSWHIWVTDGFDTDGDFKGDGLQPVQMKTNYAQHPTNSGITSNWVMPVNLGWCDRNTVTRWKDRVWYVRVRQTEGEAEPLIFKIIQRDFSKASGGTLATTSNSLFYQWGRKDPFSIISSPAYPVEELSDSSNSPSAHHTIWYPTTFYQSSQGWMWKMHPHNLWNMNMGAPETDYESGYDEVDMPVAKTVFDPSPPGYCVPHLYAFSNMLKDGGAYTRVIYNADGTTIQSGNIANFNVEDRDGDGRVTRFDYEKEQGWHFLTGYGNQTVFFPATGYIVQTNGTYHSDSAGNSYYWYATMKSGSTNSMATSVYNKYSSSDATPNYGISHTSYDWCYGFPVRAVKEQ